MPLTVAPVGSLNIVAAIGLRKTGRNVSTIEEHTMPKAKIQNNPFKYELLVAILLGLIAIGTFAFHAYTFDEK